MLLLTSTVHGLPCHAGAVCLLQRAIALTLLFVFGPEAGERTTKRTQGSIPIWLRFEAAASGESFAMPDCPAPMMILFAPSS
jgi:hypothetical protein